MASGKGLIVHALGRLMLHRAVVREVRPLSPGFVGLTLAEERPRDGGYVPGDKLQMLLPSLDTRTYTPIGWDPGRGTTELLVVRRDEDTPSTRWIRAVAPGDEVRFVGPQRSLAAPPGAPVVLFGDETSFAVATALQRAAPQRPLACVFEVGAAAEAEAVLAQLGIPGAVVIERAADHGHLARIDAELDARLAAQRAQYPEPALLMTGSARSIQALQASRRARAASRPLKTKAYWSQGKRGLD